MSMIEPECSKRKCKHLFVGDGRNADVSRETLYCAAFPLPLGIPDDIAYGSNKHSKPVPGQRNDIVYEKREE